MERSEFQATEKADATFISFFHQGKHFPLTQNVLIYNPWLYTYVVNICLCKAYILNIASTIR